ncbi:hypothetical protein ACFTXM_46695, partial [Streptomyces sp. NPDC056930]|uniref:hypothetical protein n=1 Tax=Streptomyces sp. NPDC056930 TaxID=3345967 RepID=UPI0036302CC6
LGRSRLVALLTAPYDGTVTGRIHPHPDEGQGVGAGAVTNTHAERARSRTSTPATTSAGPASPHRRR